MAGEIQLNSTTMATESSGSITAELDTIRPNTTNGSLTLQGDSSDAGVTGLTIDSSGNAAFAGDIQLNSTTFATESGGTITIDNVDSATNRQNLGLEIGVDVQAFDTDTTKNDVANTFTANQIISVTDNTNAALRVTQLGTGNALVVEDETNPDSTSFVVDASGNVTIGTTDTSATLLTTVDVAGIRWEGSFSAQSVICRNGIPLEIHRSEDDTSDRRLIGFYRRGTFCGSITGTPTATTYSTSSDYRLKENITEITDGIHRVKQLNPSRFNFISDPNTTVDGFIAHEVSDVVPEAITGEKDAVNEDGSIKPQGLDLSKLVPLLTAALQESIAKIENLETRIAQLESK